jgi:hypothetical protein
MPHIKLVLTLACTTVFSDVVALLLLPLFLLVLLLQLL